MMPLSTLPGLFNALRGYVFPSLHAAIKCPDIGCIHHKEEACSAIIHTMGRRNWQRHIFLAQIFVYAKFIVGEHNAR